MSDNTLATQHARVQRMDANGNYLPVPEEPQVQTPATEPAPRGFKIGDAVSISGRVLEVQSPQGGQTSVKVQTTAGAEWFRGQHVEFVDEGPQPLEEEVEKLRLQVDTHQKQGGEDQARIADLEVQVADLTAQLAAAKTTKK